LAEYSRDYEAIRAAGADVVALSVDDQARSEALRAQLALPYPILCDPARAVVPAWDLYNAREKGGIAFPAVFVIGPDRCVRYRSIDSTVKRASTDGVLRFLRGEARGEQVGRERVHVGLGEFARGIANALRRGSRTPRG
jgi:peroxiredoxin